MQNRVNFKTEGMCIRKSLPDTILRILLSRFLVSFTNWLAYSEMKMGSIQLMAQFRIFPSSESRHSFVANYTSAVKFKIHSLVLFCCIIIPLYVGESKYL